MKKRELLWNTPITKMTRADILPLCWYLVLWIAKCFVYGFILMACVRTNTLLSYAVLVAVMMQALRHIAETINEDS